MESLLESFDSYFYVLINTLPVSIGIGFLFFGIGYLLTNPRVVRLRQQLDHYKEESARMSRSLAKINSQHKELIENVQGKEQEKLLLQTSLETKDEELIALLDRLNNVAAETSFPEPAAARSSNQELQNLHHQIAELNGRLKTSESALRDRKNELAEARQQLARAGVEVTAGGASSQHGWHPLPTHGLDESADAATTAPLPVEPAIENLVKAAATAEIETAEIKTTAFTVEETEEAIANAELEAEAKTEETETKAEAAAEAKTEAKAEADPAPAAAEKTESPAAEPAGESAENTAESAEPDTDDLENIFGDETAELEDQLADFEERLRKKEAEFFALQEQLSFGSLGSTAAPDTPGSSAAPADSPPSNPITAFPPLSKTAPPPVPAGVTTAAADSSGATATSTAAATATVAVAVAHSTATAQPVIFRGDDPSLWGTAAGGDVVSPAKAPDDMKFLRLRREDTGQSVIIRLEKKHLLSMAPSENVIGWNGKGETFEGAHHLGIFDHSLPQEVETRFGAGGWGFGHFYGQRSGQAFCWDGIIIERTGFEISVLAQLPDSETLRQTDSVFLDAPSFPPSEDPELVFFHSAYPEIWNKNVVDGKGGFALNLCRAPRQTRFVRVRRVDNGAAVIVPATHEQLSGKMSEKNLPGWNGSDEFFFGGHHLGICEPASANEVEIKYGCGGYGFGHLVDSNDQQAFAWAGKSIAKTPFEFTAIARDLTEAESKELLSA